MGLRPISFDIIVSTFEYRTIELKKREYDKYSLINRKQITEEDIDQRTNLLKKESKYILIKAIMDKIHKKINYQEKELTYYEIIEKQVKMINNLLKTMKNIKVLKFIGN